MLKISPDKIFPSTFPYFPDEDDPLVSIFYPRSTHLACGRNQWKVSGNYLPAHGAIYLHNLL